MRLSKPPPDPFGKDIIAFDTDSKVTEEGKGWTGSYCSMLESGCGPGCLSLRALSADSECSAKSSLLHARLTAPL